MPLSLPKPGTVDAEVWDAFERFGREGLSSLNALAETVEVRRVPLYCRVDLDSTNVEWKVFSNTAKADGASNLEKGGLNDDTVAWLASPMVSCDSGRNVAGTRGVQEIIGTTTGAAAAAADYTAVVNHALAQSARNDFLKFGLLDVNIGSRPIYEAEFGLTRFPFPGGVYADGTPAAQVATAGAFSTNIGGQLLNNGVPAANNQFTMQPNQPLVPTTKLSAKFRVQTALVIPAGYYLTAYLGFDAVVFRPRR